MATSDHHAPLVLIVEDEWLIADLIECSLQDAGYRTLGPAASVSEACRLIDGHPVDAAVLDVNLGHERSYGAVDRLVERGTPHLLLTGYCQSDLPPRYQTCVVLGKPLMPSLLVRSVARLLMSAEPG